MSKALKVIVAASVFMFLVVCVAPSFAATASSDVKAVQSALSKAGYDVAVDGKMGKQTSAALKQYQQAQGLKVTGKADAATKAKLGVK